MIDQEIVTDVLVVGSGAAGLCTAIAARQGNAETLVMSLSSLGAGNATAVAGGIMNAAVGPGDSPELHLDDSIRAGAFINDRPLIARVIEEIPGCLPRLEEYGVRFFKEDGEYTQTRSPGHTLPRTLLFSPRVGISLSKPLARTAVRLGARTLPNFNLVKILVQANRAAGAIAYNWETDQVVHVSAKVVVLATGGASLLYSRTRIPPGVPGDGFGIALDVGLTLQDMEFVQSYPTVLAEPGMAKMLIGYEKFLKDGAVFVNTIGEDIVAKYGLPEPDLITRDQLSIAIGREAYEGRGVDGAVFMDASRCSREPDSALYRQSSFLRMVEERRLGGEDFFSRLIRIAPANHYYMGGVQAGIGGETAVESLLACGEVVGGTHGANRLQGNSLAETVVAGFDAGRMAANLAARLAYSTASGRAVAEPTALLREALGRRSGTPVRDILKSLQSTMTEKAGLVRDGRGLEEAKATLDALRREIPRAIAVAPKDRAHLSTISHLLDTAGCIVASAVARRESRGAHYRLDYPESDDAAWLRHVTCVKSGEEIITSTCPVR